MATSEEIQKVRYELADTDVSFPMLSDEEYSYFIDKNNSSIGRASIDAAKTILFKLSMRSSTSTVDIFSIRGRDAAEQYRLALQMYIKDPNNNPLLSSLSIYASGLSKQDMLDNNAELDTVRVITPNEPVLYETQFANSTVVYVS